MNEAVAVASRGAVSVATPFGKLNLYITLGVLMFLVVYGSIQSIHQKNIYPLLDSVIFKTVGADHKISQSLDSLPPILTEGQPRFLSSQWFSYWWKMFELWLGVIISLWFIYIVIYGLYKIFQGLNSINTILNVGYAIIMFAILQIIVGLALYPTLLAGQTMPTNKITILNDAFAHSYPFEGCFKLISRIVTGTMWDSAYAFLQTDTGQFISNVPTSVINDASI